LGIQAQPRKIYASTDNDCLSYQYWTVNEAGYDPDAVVLWAENEGTDGEIGNGPKYNYYQTVGYTVADKKYWNVYPGGDARVVRNNSCDMFNFITELFAAQYWVIFKNWRIKATYKLFSSEDTDFHNLVCND